MSDVAGGSVVSSSARTESLEIAAVEARVQRDVQHQFRRARISGLVYPIATSIVILVLWEGIVRVFNVPTYLVPPPTQVWSKFMGSMPLLMQHGWISTQEILLGYGLSVLVGIPLALAIFLSRPFAQSVYPLLVASQAVPKTAIAPLFIVWFGFGVLPKVLIGFLIAFFPIVISTVVGLASIEPEKLYLARSMGLSAWSTFFKIRLPQALPSVFGGLKVAITLAVVGAIVGEFVGANAGLGYLLLLANGSLDTPLLFAGFLALTIIGVVLFAVLEVLERLAIPWHTSHRSATIRESM